MQKKKNFLSPISSKSVVQIVIDRITDAIIEGELKPGDRIPTEPELVESFGVGRNTVREAIRILVAYGVLEIRRADGTYVCNGFTDKIINPMLYSVILQKEDSYKDLIGLRAIIEKGVMQTLLDQKLTDAEWEDLNNQCMKLVHIIERKPPNARLILEGDIDFHNALAAATGNSLIIIIHDVVVNLTRDSRLKTIQKVIEKDDIKYLADTHKGLMEALKSGKSDQLSEAIQDSYFYWKDIYKD